MSTYDDAARLQALLDIAKVVGAARRFDDLIELTAEEARRALDAASLSILRWEGERGQLRVIVNVGLLGPGEVRFPVDEVYPVTQFPRSHTLVELRRAYVADRTSGDEEADLLVALGKDSSLGVPIIVDARVWGALYATRVGGQTTFTTADLDFGTAVATHVATGVVQADHVARIERLAFEDPLTGLANRRAVDDRLEAAFDAGASRTHPVSVVLADINRLKQINDSFGHEAGDRLINSVGQAVSRASGVVPGSLAARIGGDEFCIVVTGVDASAAEAIANELCRLVDSQPMSTGVSCGVASSDAVESPVDTPVQLLRLADAAQYRAKRGGLRRPVVAGQVNAVDGIRGEAPGIRRRRRGRSPALVPDTLDSGLAVLDGMRECSAAERLQAIAEHVSERVDAAAWWLSDGPPDGSTVVSVTTSVHRAATADPSWDQKGAIGATFVLADYPASQRAVLESSSYAVERDIPGNDPAEEELLVLAGYQAVIAAGTVSAGPAGSAWLVEIYSDRLSLPLLDLEPVLRALVAVAVAGAGRPVAAPDSARATPAVLAVSAQG